jgi:Tol biopolymer transport system component
MPLTAGARLGPYEVQSLLGAGGMGEVYRARDSRLKRDVAIKVLPEQFAGDADRLARFRREAELLATLTHPNIAGVHGLEETSEGAAIVMELVAGETLADRLLHGPIVLDEALAIARQIADGLEAAHEKGVVHRDLKPANIKITPYGQVKILDFGLAKLLEESPAPASLAMSPTLSVRATAAGVILGTAAYMSPEQARGRAVDRRTDIWAFGCVLFEMLTGRRAFDSDDTISDVVAAILKSDVEWSTLPADTPAELRTLLRRCLHKDRAKRLPHIGLARVEIDDVLAGQTEGAPAAPAAPRRAPWRLVMPWALALVALAAAAVAVWRPWRTTDSPAPPLRLTADLGADASLVAGLGPSAVLSPNGEQLVLAAQRSSGEQPMLYVRGLDQLQARQLPGTEGAASPFFAPDGNWVAFFADGKLKKIAVNGGAVATICDAPAGRGGSWAEDDTIVFSPANVEGTGLMRVSSGGGRPEPITTVEKGEFSHRWPQVLPGGKGILYTANVPGFSFENASIVVQPLPSGERKVVRREAFFGRYVPSGHLLYVQGGTLSAAAFDLDRFEVVGPPVAIVQGIGSNASSGGVQISASDTGTLVYVPGASTGGPAAIAWLTRSGQRLPLRTTPSDWSNPRFAPNGTTLAFDVVEGRQTDIWTYEWPRDALSRLTFDTHDDVLPLWDTDGRRIVFASTRGSGSVFNLYWQRADGSGAVQRLTESRNPQLPMSWHPSASLLAFQEQTAASGWDIMLLPLARGGDGSWTPGKPRPFLNGPENESGAAFSPDGRWIAYDSTETGRPEVYVRPFPAGDRKWLISAGGRDSVWSRTSNELFYLSLDSRIMVVSYTMDGDSFVAGRPQVWTPSVVGTRARYKSYDLHPDGTRFAIPEAAAAQAPERQNTATFVFNFFSELGRTARVERR